MHLHTPSDRPNPRSADDTIQLAVLGPWQLRINQRQAVLTLVEQQVLAVLAVQGAGDHDTISQTLWPKTASRDANAALSEAIRGIHELNPVILACKGEELALSPTVKTDLDDLRTTLTACISDPSNKHTYNNHNTVRVIRPDELLTEWHDPWVILARERLHDDELRYLLILSRHGHDSGQHHLSIRAATEALRIDPLNKTALDLLIPAQLAIGDIGSAASTYRLYRHRSAGATGARDTARLESLRAEILRAFPPIRRRVPE